MRALVVLISLLSISTANNLSECSESAKCRLGGNTTVAERLVDGDKIVFHCDDKPATESWKVSLLIEDAEGRHWYSLVHTARGALREFVFESRILIWHNTFTEILFDSQHFFMSIVEGKVGPRSVKVSGTAKYISRIEAVGVSEKCFIWFLRNDSEEERRSGIVVPRGPPATVGDRLFLEGFYNNTCLDHGKLKNSLRAECDRIEEDLRNRKPVGRLITASPNSNAIREQETVQPHQSLALASGFSLPNPWKFLIFGNLIIYGACAILIGILACAGVVVLPYEKGLTETERRVKEVEKRLFEKPKKIGKK